MKRFTGVEAGGLILAAVLFGTGLATVMRPQPSVATHFVTMGDSGAGRETFTEVMGVSGAMLYGIMLMLVGVLIAVFVFPRKKD